MSQLHDPATRRVTEIYEALAYFTKLLNARRAVTQQVDGVTGAQLRALRALEAGPTGMRALGDRLYVQPSTASGMVDRLEAKRLVRRRRSTADRRRVEVTLTSEGAALIAAAPQSVVQRVLDALHALPAEELADIHGAVQRMHELLMSTVAEVYGTARPEEGIA